jgi:hypothetical protein
MYAKAVISSDYNKEFYFNSYMNPAPIVPEEHIGTIDGKWLSDWENGLYLLSKTAELKQFALYKEVPALPTVSCKIGTTLTALTADWGGTINSYYVGSDGKVMLLGQVVIPRIAKADQPANGGDSVPDALNRCLGYILRSRNRSPASPQRGGLFLFYDADADTYRNGQWPWSWGPAIRLLLDCTHLDQKDLAFPKEELLRAAVEIGNASLRFQISNPAHTSDRFGTTRYTVRTNEKYGYQELVNTGSDAGFLAGWGWVALYRETGDERYLAAAKDYLAAMEPVLRAFPVPPQEWLPASESWTDFTIDESGFGTEGIDAVYQATHESKYQDLCIEYMDKHLAIFERGGKRGTDCDGLWDRQYHFSTGQVDPTEYMTRGLGWAMEGLLAAYRCTGRQDYLDKASRMAGALIRYQQPDGSWAFKCNRSVSEAGAADKGTSLWCLLLYMLYRETHEEPVLSAARRALRWCMDNQYRGSNPHAYGGIISVSGESGITYRHWFRLCCQYTSAFFGLALLEELKSRET